MNQLLEFSEALLDSLEKTAAELDSRDVELASLRLETQKLKAAAAVTPSSPTLPPPDKALLLKLACQLEREGLLLEGMTSEAAASAMAANPNLIAKLASSLVTPLTEGVAITSHKPSPEDKQAQIVEFNGRKFRDPDGFLSVLG